MKLCWKLLRRTINIDGTFSGNIKILYFHFVVVFFLQISSLSITVYCKILFHEKSNKHLSWVQKHFVTQARIKSHWIFTSENMHILCFKANFNSKLGCTWCIEGKRSFFFLIEVRFETVKCLKIVFYIYNATKKYCCICHGILISKM